MTRERKPIHEQLREAREARGVTQADLAERIGVHYSRVCKYEGGHHYPSLGTLRAYAAALRLGIEVLPDGETVRLL